MRFPIYIERTASRRRLVRSVMLCERLTDGGSAGDGNEAVDQLARILLEVSAPSRENELPEAMRSIRRRWQQQRLRELSAELEQAQRQGDNVRLERILKEKTALSAELHRSGTQT